MKIAIDCRLYAQTGVGRYIRAILKELKLQAKNQDNREYVLIVRNEDLDNFADFPKNIKIVPTNAKWHSFKEQLVIPKILLKEKVDLVHFPYFNVPIFTTTKFIVTIHDLIINKFKTGKATNLPFLAFLFKKIAYLIVMFLAVKRSVKILTVSETVKKGIIETYGVKEAKVKVIYNGSELEEEYLDVRVDEQRKEKLVDGMQNTKYILYVGNLHPHKNVETLILAYDLLIKDEEFHDFKLVIVSPFDFFYKKLFAFVKKLKLERRIEFTGHVDSTRLNNLYKNARCFVSSSLSEGFGIPGVEAMRSGCPVIVSDLPIFHEIYGDAALYFQTKNAEDLKEKIITVVLNINLRNRLYSSGLEQAKKYSWEECARGIFEVYENWGA